MISDILSGFNYLLLGLQLIRQPTLRRFVIFPVLINTLVFSAAISIGVYQFDILLDWLMPEGNSWWIETARTAIWIFFALLTLLITYLTFTILANLIGSPFNSLLSEKVEELLAGNSLKNSGGFRELIASIVPSVASELKKLLYFSLLGCTIFLVMLIPVINILSPFVWAFFTSWMMSLEYLAYPMENHKIFFSEVKNKLKKRKSLSFGFGLAVMTVSMVPVLNFIIMPAAVAGATALWFERLSSNAPHITGANNRRDVYYKKEVINPIARLF